MSDEFSLEQRGDAGASLTVPKQSGTVRKNEYAMLKGFPCKVVEATSSKTGKHGHAKVNFTGIDVFTDKKYTDVYPSTQNIDVPTITRETLNFIEQDGDDFFYMDMSKEDQDMERIPLPADEDLANKIKGAIEKGVGLTVSVLRFGEQVRIVEARPEAE